MQYGSFANIINSIATCVFIFSMYFSCRYNSKNSIMFKKKSLFMSGFVGREYGEESVRAIYIGILVIVFVIFLKLTDNLYKFNLFPKQIVLSIFLMILSIIALVQILFLMIMIVGRIFDNNYMGVMKELDLLQVDIKKLVYTGYIRTLIVAVFEVYIFFYVIFNMILKLGASGITAIFGTVLIYSLSKLITRKKLEKSILQFIMGVALSIPAIILIKACDSLFIGTLFMYICFILIAFKNVKVRM